MCPICDLQMSSNFIPERQEISVEFHRTVRKSFLRNTAEFPKRIRMIFPYIPAEFPHISTEW